MFYRLPIAAFSCLALSGCQPYVVPPSLDEVSPNWGFNGDDTDVEIAGTNLFPGVDAQGGSIKRFEREFVAELVGPQSAALASVRLHEEGVLRATVEGGLPPGWYDLNVQTPAGHSSTLEAAFEVTDSRIDHLRITTDTPTNQVQKFTILRVSLRDPSGRLVEQVAPVSITLAPADADPTQWTFDFGDMEDAELLPDGTGFTGNIGPAGEAYFGFRSDAPGSFWINIEAPIRDRVTVANTTLVQFQAGTVSALDIEPVEDNRQRTAGEEFDIDLRLVDAAGNTVSGTVASVLLTESCVGGTFQHLETFVDDARVSVRPTKACPDNRIIGLAVVEAQSIQGESEPFAVQSGQLKDLSVSAAPTEVLAGQEELSIRLQGQDAWSNPVDVDLGDIRLLTGSLPLDEGAGTGSYACSSLGGGSSLCTATLFTAGPSVVIRATSSTGATGDSNPVIVYPGPVEQLEIRGEAGVVEAGSPYRVNVSAIDRFGNRLPLSGDDRTGLAFFDRYGSLECSDLGPDESPVVYPFECRLVVAGRDNEIRVVLPTLGAVGSHAPVSVKAARISEVGIVLEEELHSHGVRAGERFRAQFDGRDAYGNKGEGTTSVSLLDISGGVTPNTVTLTDGAAELDLHTTIALPGNSVWAFVDDHVAGSSMAFDVGPGETAGLSILTTAPWAFDGEELGVEIAVVDVYGNHVPDEPTRVTLHDGTEEIDTEVVNGVERFGLSHGTAGDTYALRAQSERFSTSIPPIPIVQDCPDDSPKHIEIIGSEEGRVCLTEGADARVRLVAPTEAHDWMVTRDSHPLDIVDETSIDLVWTDPGASDIKSLVVSGEDCGWEETHRFSIGTDAEVTGPVTVTLAKDRLFAGTSTLDAFTDVWVQGRTCTGDVASHRELTIQAMLGATYERSTFIADEAAPTMRLTLDGSGEGTFLWSMHNEAVGGTAQLLVGTPNGSASTRQHVDVEGDATPPTVWELSPLGSITDETEMISITFSEPMLDHILLEAAASVIAVHDPDGLELTLGEYFWTDGQRVLNFPLETPLSPEEGVWSISISDDMRDAAGNRLDGDWDGESGGAWNGYFGGMVALESALTNCKASLGWFDPFPSDLEYTGETRPQIHFSLSSTAPSTWWRMDILDKQGTIVRRIEHPRSGLTTGNVSWDGRNEDGHVVENETYTARLTPLDEYRNDGRACHVSFVVDSPLQR